MNPPEPRISSPPWQTPGVDGDARAISYRDRRGKRRTLAHVYGSSADERDANARLIALAPRMAETLRGLLAYADAALAGEAGDLDAVRGARAIVRELDGGVLP